MAQHSIATVINFCSNETAFLKPCLTEALKFSKKVYVVAADYFFDGTEENLDLLFQLFSYFPKVRFVLYPFMPKKIQAKAGKLYKKVGEDNFWHSFSRLVGFFQVDKNIEYTLFLDVDEIVDGDLFHKWLDTCEYQKYVSVKPANYWYFRETKYRADTLEDSAVMIKNSQVKLSSILKKSERAAIFDEAAEPKIRKVLFESKALIHHYSWVRSKQQMLKKVKSWGHRNDRFWSFLVAQEFAQDFQGKDFVHGYSFQEVKPFYQINLEQTLQDFVKNKIKDKHCLKKRVLSNIQPLSMKEALSLLKKI